jgi:hypothetical protein
MVPSHVHILIPETVSVPYRTRKALQMLCQYQRGRGVRARGQVTRETGEGCRVTSQGKRAAAGPSAQLCANASCLCSLSHAVPLLDLNTQVAISAPEVNVEAALQVPSLACCQTSGIGHIEPKLAELRSSSFSIALPLADRS